MKHLCALMALALAACGTSPAQPAADAGAPHAGRDASAFVADATTPPDADYLAPDASPAGLDAAASPGPDAASAGPDAAAPAGPDAAEPPDAAIVVTNECDAGEAWCTGALTRSACLDTPAGRRLQDQTCPAGSGCLGGLCVPGSCTDECALGDSQGAKTCQLVDVNGNAAVADPAVSMHDRARGYEAWLRRNGLSAGGVGDPYYADPPTYAQQTSAGDLGDSAIWTGTWLAAESLRLIVTGESDARDSVKQRVATLHDWMNVSGDPGSLARFAVRSDQRPAWTLGDLTCQDPSCQACHCGVSYGGATWDWLGHISRDQYQGVLLGLSLAYEALGEEDEPTRAIIRGDVVTFVQQLMAERNVPMVVTINGIPIPLTAKLRFVVLTSAEMNNGAIQLTVDLSDTNDAQMYGFQEFTPDLKDIVSQVPGFSWVPSIPRSSSAVMLASFFRVALQVTEGVPSSAADRAAILDYYLNHSGPGGNINDWLAIALQWTFTDNCGSSYYANNITFEPLYDLARLEDDPTRQQTIRSNLLGTKIWPSFATQKNSFFAFIAAANIPSADPSIAATGASQLAGFPVAPHIHHGIDLTNDPRYQPHDSSCTNEVDHSLAVDVADREVGDFIWQRDPWTLYDAGDEHQIMPGVDYLVAYWLGRRHGFVLEDASGRCAAWR